MKKIVNFITFVILFSFGAAAESTTDSLGRNNFNQDFIQLSQALDDVRQALGITKSKNFYITGGSAIAILDHLLKDSPLQLKDFDISFVDKKINERRAQELSNALEASRVSKLSQIVPKQWGNGWGFFHTHLKFNTLLDIAIFPDLDGILDKSGLLDIERVKIIVKPGESLIDVARSIQNQISKGRHRGDMRKITEVIDPDRGYLSWTKKKPRIVKYSELTETPVIATMRIIRRFAKLDAEFSTELHQILSKNLSRSSIAFDKDRAARHFSYFFDDRNLAEELKFAAEIGLFRHLLPSFESKIRNLSLAKLRRIFPFTKTKKETSTERYRMERMKPLLQMLANNERMRLVTSLSLFYPSLKIKKQSRNVSKIMCHKVFKASIFATNVILNH